MFEHRESRDFHFQFFTIALYQRAIGFQRLYQLEYRADIICSRVTQFGQGLLRHHRAHTVAGKKFHQHCAVGLAIQKMYPPDTFAAGANSTGQHTLDVMGLRHLLVNQMLRFIDGQGVDSNSASINQPRCVAQINQLVGFNRHCHRFRHFFPGEIENLTRWRRADRRNQDHIFLRQVGQYFLGDHLAYRAGVLEVDTVDHTNRSSGDEVAASHAQKRTGQRCVRQALREQGLNLEVRHPHRALDAFQCLGIGDSQAIVKARFQASCAHLGINLRPCAADQHQAYADGIQQSDVMNQGLCHAFREHLAAKRNDKTAATKSMDVRRGLAYPSDRAFIGLWGSGACLYGHFSLSIFCRLISFPTHHHSIRTQLLSAHTRSARF